jgi:large subunit ribosomal protein L13
MIAKPNKQIERAVHVLDAKDVILGRLATQAATLLRGKHKVSFELHQDQGDYVTIINAAQIKVTGNKLEDKKYYSHSGYIGNLKTISLDKLLAKSPTKVLEHAVKGMLPKNRLQAKWMRRLKVYAGEQE